MGRHFRGRRKNDDTTEQVRTILPDKRRNEVFGYVERKLGAYRMYVKCADGKIRTCRIPGAIRRKIWIKENDLVIVKPWELEEDTKGDIVHLYRKGEEANLRSRGFLKAFETEI